ncbi:MAG: oligosaccharyltransferase [Deltaproteobacteria bacterium]|nr:MAG: oligosaccharyltransferase [Deltaproteobacteria bacterium]TMQ16636.1 MAG: oligosaccharyltransferase [Deltaproteobacteria bacterium]
MTESSTAGPSSLTARTIRGAAWTLSTSLGSRVIGLIGSLLLLRYLRPDDYGEVTNAQIVTLTAFGVTSLGVGTYLLSNRELSRAQVFHATCWFVATGVAALGLVWALAGPIGDWLQAPHMARYMPFFVLAAVLDRILFFPERMLIRRLRFRWTSLSRALGELTYTALSLLLAVLGAGAMAIAWANLARSVLRFVAIVPAVHWREWLEPHRLEMRLLRPIIRAGAGISVASIAAFLMRRADNLLVSRYFGTATMGTYNYAYNLADTPAVAIGEQLSDVVAAAFPHAEGAKRQTALVRACTTTALIMFPLAFGLGAVSETVGQAFFDRKWAGIGPMLMFLSILSAPRPTAQIVGSYLYAAQRIRIVVWLEWLSLGALVAAIVAIGAGMAGTTALGASAILWTCGAVGAVFVLRTLAYLWVVKRLDGVPLRRFLVPLIRPLAVCIAMVAAILAIRPELAGLSPRLRLLVEIAIGAAIYGLGALVVFRDLAVEVLGMVRASMARR